LNLELEGKVAVVVGGAHGIGKAIAEAFAAEKARVVIADCDAAAKATAAEIATTTGTAIQAMVADATDYAAMSQVAQKTVQLRHRCDHVVYAAGIGSGKFGFPFWNLEPNDWNRVIKVNLLGAVNVAHAFAPHLIEAGAGSLLFLSSIAGQIGSQTDPPYSAAKAGVINFAQCAAKDLAPHNVRVNTICPGMIKTQLNRSVWQAWYDQQPDDTQRSYEEWAGDKVRQVAPLGRWQTAADVAALAVFLASCQANNITGQTMNVDGGQVMHW
jgi:NAD(P)-dependent dehydrogenase (short-subunit alcohol dehydrogenase family)